MVRTLLCPAARARRVLVTLLVLAACSDDAPRPDARPADAAIDAEEDIDAPAADARPTPDARADARVVVDARPDVDAGPAGVAACDDVCTALAACPAGDAGISYGACFAGCVHGIADCSAADITLIDACKDQPCADIASCVHAVPCSL
jgi:hypothetical protein